MTPLVWANFPLMAVIFLAIAGIPLWMVFRRPDKAPDHAEAHRYLEAKADLPRQEAAGTVPAHVPEIAAAASWASPRRGRWQLSGPRGSMPGRRRPPAGASRPHGRDAAARRRRSQA